MLKRKINSVEKQNKPKKKINVGRLLKNYGPTVLIGLTHIAVILAIISSWRYYSIYPSLFGSIVGIVVCLLIIIDIVFFVGFNHQDKALKIISCTLIFFMLIGGTVGSFYIGKVNSVVNNVLSGDVAYETYSGKFVCYDKNNQFTSIEDLNGKKIGLLTETTKGITYAATNFLKNSKVENYETVSYSSNTGLLTALIDGNVDAVAITSAYRTIYDPEKDENSPFAGELNHFIDFASFEEKIKIDSNKTNKDISKDPFNVLLIGYSRTDIGSPIGLADSIILATVNPLTYEVSMMSIARDSFVPIACYGGEYDKINSGRATSRACFIETVENFVGMDIDYYMELDYMGLVAIVDTIGGVMIDNPVEFTLDGVTVPAGKTLAMGMTALQFCRERHSMPNGDFDRQQHQKEVIIGIAKKFIESGSISLALDAMENASDFMSTDLTLNQLTNIFNILLKTKNYTGMDTFDLVNFQTLRMTGSGGIKYYSYSMELPLWVYLIYEGSYKESMQHVYDTMGKYDSINQNYSFGFSMREKYVRPELYSLEYEDKFMYEPDPMPAFWANFTGMTTAEVMAWAKEKGVTVTVDKVITAKDADYDAELEGKVVDQSVRYGALISNVKSCTITVMGSAEIDESKMVPDFIGHNYSKAVEWADEYDIDISIDFDPKADGKVGDVVKQYPEAYTDIEEVEELEIVVKAGQYTIKFDKNGQGLDSEVPSSITVTTGDSKTLFKSMSDVATTATSDGYTFLGWYTAKTGGTLVDDSLDVSGNCTVYAQWEKICSHTWDTTKKGVDDSSADTDGWFITLKPTCTTDGTKKRVCTKCGKEDTETVKASGHIWDEGEETTPPTCKAQGVLTKTCTVCGAKTTESINPTDHTYSEGTCTECGAADPNYTTPESQSEQQSDSQPEQQSELPAEV